ncbi:MAG: SAM-dependent chlorinase/fluorinase [Flavobacteriaceae bacterium]|jgi:S-adenosylmethionine hydrolase|nr:SAM-dependent chlorinase/fluorinase [Flavobacteriaceae bacterium]
MITLTSDFGLTDYKVAAIKGGILNLKKDIRIVDITHEIQPYNLLQTSYIVRNAFRYFPKGTVHIISVDSFYAQNVKSIIYKCFGQYFIAADNGVLSLIFFDAKPEAVYEITMNKDFDSETKFVSTDIFVPAAVHLQSGGLPEEIGKEYKTPKQNISISPVFNKTQKIISGEAIYIDHFGNVVSNISKDFFEKNKADFQNFKVRFRNVTLRKIYDYHTEFVTDWKKEHEFHGKVSAIFNEAGLLEIIIYKGSENSGAKTLFGISVGETIYVEFD